MATDMRFPGYPYWRRIGTFIGFRIGFHCGYRSFSIDTAKPLRGYLQRHLGKPIILEPDNLYRFKNLPNCETRWDEGDLTGYPDQQGRGPTSINDT